MQRNPEPDCNLISIPAPSSSDVNPNISVSPNISAHSEPSEQPDTFTLPYDSQIIDGECCEPTGANVQTHQLDHTTPLDETTTFANSDEQGSSCTGPLKATITDELVDEEWAYGYRERIKRRHRLALAEVGRELTSFNSTRELLEVIIHSIEGTI